MSAATATRNVGSLTITLPSDREIAMTRVFDAPRTLVYDAHTKPELMKRWLFGPDGWELAVCEVDLRVGGNYRNVWRHVPGRKPVMGMGGVFRELAGVTNSLNFSADTLELASD